MHFSCFLEAYKQVTKTKKQTLIRGEFARDGMPAGWGDGHKSKRKDS